MSIDPTTYRAIVGLLDRELVCALGCTEPIALAYGSALAAAALGEPAEHLHVRCSGNIIKNVKGVSVPNAEGMKGVECAAVLGCLVGDPERRLEVLEAVTHQDVLRAKDLIAQGFCTVELVEEVPNLYIVVDARGTSHTASATLRDRHTNVVALERDGAPVTCGPLGTHVCCEEAAAAACDTSKKTDLLTMEIICTFAREVDPADVREVLDRQIACNSAIAREGLDGHWGSEVGRTILATRPADVVTRMRARSAAGSDARMGGCSLPVVINSGSGNQGMTVSLPVIEYAETIRASHEDLLRALCISNLTALHLKHYIGSLSAFCGVVCAAAGAGAAVTYLAGGTDDQIGSTVINTIANVGGIVCDGAKASCAAKIASSVDAAMIGHSMAMLDGGFCAGDGLVQDTVEATIMSMGYVGRVGMHSTDVEILNIMIGKTCLEEMGC